MCTFCKNTKLNHKKKKKQKNFFKKKEKKSHHLLIVIYKIDESDYMVVSVCKSLKSTKNRQSLFKKK